MSAPDGKCQYPGCDNGADPRWCFHVDAIPRDACDGHGCCSGAECGECALTARLAEAEARRGGR